MHEPNIRGNAAGQAFKPGVLTGRYQPRILDEIDDGWIGVIDRTRFGIHPSGDLLDRVENYFLAWSNSERRDLEALGMLDSPGGTDALFGIYPAAMTDEQLDAALALMERRQASWGNAEAKRRCEIELLEAEKSASDHGADAGLRTPAATLLT